MTQATNRYFIATIPPSPLFEEALSIKHYFKEHYNSSGALNSPPHITLHMPFLWKSGEENLLFDALKKFSLPEKAVTVRLKGLGCFPPRVIFISIFDSPELKAFQKRLSAFCLSELNTSTENFSQLPFHPHLTVAFRDLKKQSFVQAWEEFRNKSFIGEYRMNQISLLKHDGWRWSVLENFPFGQSG